MLWQEYRIRGEGEQRTDLTLLLATLMFCPLAFSPMSSDTSSKTVPGVGPHHRPLSKGVKTPCWRLKQEGLLLPIPQYSMLQRAVAKLGRPTVLQEQLAPFQAILSGLIVW